MNVFVARSDALAEATTEVLTGDVIDVPTGRHDTVSDWLLSMGLQHYLCLLNSNGFDDIDFLVSNCAMRTAYQLNMRACCMQIRRIIQFAATKSGLAWLYLCTQYIVGLVDLLVPCRNNMFANSIIALTMHSIY